MASADFQKIKTAQETKAKIAHDDTQKRLQHDHTNKHIDKTKTHKNLTYFDSENYGYEEVCKRYDSILEILDKKPKANKRKDRVTCVSIEIPTPDDLKPEDEDKFFYCCGQVLCEKYGDENLLQGYFHKDEQHDYYDADSKEMKRSRNHGTFRFIPIVEGKLNAKQFTKKSNIVDVNNQLQDMCQREFGIPFHNGKGKRGKTVEQLKNDSEKALQMLELEKERKQLEKERKAHEQDVEVQKFFDNVRQKKLDDKEQKLKTDQDALKQAKKALERDRVNYRQEARKEVLRAFKERMEQVKELCSQVQDYLTQLKAIDLEDIAMWTLQSIKFNNGRTGLDRYNDIVRGQSKPERSEELLQKARELEEYVEQMNKKARGDYDYYY